MLSQTSIQVKSETDSSQGRKAGESEAECRVSHILQRFGGQYWLWKSHRIKSRMLFWNDYSECGDYRFVMASKVTTSMIWRISFATQAEVATEAWQSLEFTADSPPFPSKTCLQGCDVVNYAQHTWTGQQKLDMYHVTTKTCLNLISFCLSSPWPLKFTTLHKGNNVDSESWIEPVALVYTSLPQAPALHYHLPIQCQIKTWLSYLDDSG